MIRTTLTASALLVVGCTTQIVLAEQAEKDSPKDAVAVAFLERAMDFAHFAYGRDGAKTLTLHMLKDIQERYDFERN